MPTCPYCGTENNQPGAAYCTACGSSLRQAQQSFSQSPPAPSSTPPIAQPTGWSQGSSSSGYGTSERYERAFKSVEQMGNAVVILAVVALILLLY